VRIEPTSCAEVGARRQLVDMEQGFQPLEREFDLPPEPVCDEDLHGRVVLRRQRGAENQKLRGDQGARIEHLLFAARLRVQRLARGRHGLGRLAQDDEADRRRQTALDQGLNVDLVGQLIVRQAREVIDLVSERRAVAILRHKTPEAVLIPVDDYVELVKLRRERLNLLTQRYDQMIARMRTAEAAAGVDALFNASAEELGRAAVAAANGD